jgi:pimeloyl-ACP methyl ester carboxylesterase
MRRIALILIVILTLAAQSVTAQTDSLPRFESAECAFTAPSGRAVECGYLIVPEDRQNPEGGTLRLHVAIIKAASSNPAPDPVVYLEGGPGGSALEQIDQTFEAFFEPYAQQRDFIVFDQRGTGFSEPALECPEATLLLFDMLEQHLTTEEEISLELQAVAACRKRLVAQDINFNAYTSAENAADLADLRLALGIESWNLYGISYGTRLALTAMRDHPDGIRSVILDSTYPPQVDLFATAAVNFDRALQVLFDDCASDPACNTAYPDLEEVLFETAERLNADPVTVEAVRPSTKETYQMVIDGGLLMDFMFQSLYQTDWLASLPQIIYAANQGDFSLFTLLYMAVADSIDTISYGMNLSVQCNEEVPFGMPVGEQSERVQRLQGYLNAQLNLGENMAKACAIWTSSPTANPLENQPVHSSIPTLVMSGQYDPITPPEWGQLVAADLSQSSFFEYPAVGHGASVEGGCPTEMALAFLDDPSATPDASCIAQMEGVAFIVPETLQLIPFEEPLFNISGVVPEGWEQVAPGAYGRSSVGDVAISQLSLPGFGLEESLDLILTQLQVTLPDDPLETRQANDFIWAIYRFELQGLVFYMAAAEQDNTTYLILIQAPSSEIDGLYEELFLPAIDALKPL